MRYISVNRWITITRLVHFGNEHGIARALYVAGFTLARFHQEFGPGIYYFRKWRLTFVKFSVWRLNISIYIQFFISKFKKRRPNTHQNRYCCFSFSTGDCVAEQRLISLMFSIVERRYLDHILNTPFWNKNHNWKWKKCQYTMDCFFSARKASTIERNATTNRSYIVWNISRILTKSKYKIIK